jgi:hypothetical protein
VHLYDLRMDAEHKAMHLDVLAEGEDMNATDVAFNPLAPHEFAMAFEGAPSAAAVRLYDVRAARVQAAASRDFYDDARGAWTRGRHARWLCEFAPDHGFAEAQRGSPPPVPTGHASALPPYQPDTPRHSPRTNWTRPKVRATARPTTTESLGSTSAR